MIVAKPGDVVVAQMGHGWSQGAVTEAQMRLDQYLDERRIPVKIVPVPGGTGDDRSRRER